MIADSTSASSGLTTSSRSVSVLDGTMCSSGISSPVPGSRYWTRLWWVSSVSSSTRMPVIRSTSTAAQAQNAWCSSRVRLRRGPPSGFSAHTLAACARVVMVRRSVCPVAVNTSPGVAALAAVSRSAVALRWLSVAAIRAGRMGSRSRVRWSMRDLRRSAAFL